MKLSLLLIAVGVTAFGQTADQVWNSQLASFEKEFVPLVDAMPTANFGFAPTGAEFKNSRTFAEQARHVATVTYELGAAILGVACPVETGKNENGPEMASKEAVLKYSKDAMEYGHKALATLTNANQMELVKSPFGGKPTPRMALASIMVWHGYDHYGQMVIYARMKEIVPPASR